jgi:hypothetical protein
VAFPLSFTSKAEAGVDGSTVSDIRSFKLNFSMSVDFAGAGLPDVGAAWALVAVRGVGLGRGWVG